MPFIDQDKQEINFKLVYYGTGLVGKTTNMQYIHARTAPESKSKLISMASETDRVLFFDFRPLSLGKVRDLNCRFHLHTAPGPVFYDMSRRLILKDADGVIFVADSQKGRAEANVESLEGLESNLTFHGSGLAAMPIVLQYNKRDLPEILSVSDLDAMLNPAGRPRFEAIARTGVGVFDTLKEIVKQVLVKVKRGDGA